MGCEKNNFKKDVNVKKLQTISVVLMFIMTVLISGFPLISAAPTPDTIITYIDDGGIHTEINYSDGDTVIVNYSSSSMNNDPPNGCYNITATNLNTSEWVYVTVMDNSSGASYNQDSDGNYWGQFNLSTDEDTMNATGPGDVAVLNCSPGNIINISERSPPYPLDNDSDIAFHHVRMNSVDGGSNSALIINGFVKDTENVPLSNVTVIFMQHGEEGFFNQTNTNETGFYEFNFTALGEQVLGRAEMQVTLDGYVTYFNWDFSLEEMGVHWNNITMTPYFNETAHIQGRVTDISTGDGINQSELILIDTDFTHAMEMDGKEDYYSNKTGYFSIAVNYSGTFNLIAFKDGYYVNMISIQINTTDEGENLTQHVTLEPALPDNQEINIVFTDLDDITVTVNRTIVAESRIVRFLLDSMQGDGNQFISQSEVTSYLEELQVFGPTVNVSLDDEMEDEEGPPDFLDIPVNFLLDHSNLDLYEPGTLNATMENIVNTTVTSNESIYFNATFQLTLDGTVLNQLLHNFTLSSEYAVLIDNQINISFTQFYKVNETNNNTNMSIQNGNNWVLIEPGNGTLDSLAYAWIDLDLNTSNISLPIIETPTWRVTDEWNYEKTSNLGQTTQTIQVKGKPMQTWDREQYMIPYGESSVRYLCYELLKEENNQQTLKFTTINNLDWIEVNNQKSTIRYIINDLDFPLYADKEWETVSWWGENVTATVVETNTIKTTGEGDIEQVILVNYTNDIDTIVAQEWYNPSLKSFINRTHYFPDGSINTSLNLIAHSFGAFIQSIDQPYRYDTDGDSSYEGMRVNVTINTSGLTQNTDLILEGSLFKESHGFEPPTDITWIHQELVNLDNSTDVRTFMINYSGSLIYGRGVHGPYNGWLELREWDEWGSGILLGSIEFETDDYDYTEFEKPAVIVTNITDFGNDTNNNSLYDYLTLNVTINVTQPGNYSINSGLDYVVSQGFWDEWFWITGTGSGPIEFSSTGNYTIQLQFQGDEIFDKGYNGNYRYHLDVVDEETWTRIFEKNGDLTHPYNYTAFETPSLYFNKTYMSQYTHHDAIIGSELLINASIYVGENAFEGSSNTYEIHGGVHYTNENNTDDWGEFITGNGKDIILFKGENLVQLSFDASEIRPKLLDDGLIENISFKVGLGFSEKIGSWYGPDIDNIDYFTQHYIIDDFPEPGITLNITDSEITDAGNWLTTIVNITINDANFTGNYEIHGGVHWIDNSTGDNDWWFITGNGQSINLSSTGITTLQLNFSGMEIASSDHDGPYAIYIGLERTTDWMQVASDEYYTPAYTTGDFVQPSVLIEEDNISERINETGFFTITVPITVTNTGTYHIGSGIHWIDTSQGWDDWRFITGTGKEDQFSVGSHNITLNFEQGMIKNELEDQNYNGPLILHIGIDNVTNWTPIASTEYETNESYSASDFTGSGINIIDHSLDISAQGDLILNVTVNATKNGSYTVHGGLHWIEQMQHWDNWIFITGIYRETETFNVGINYREYQFNGGEIYNSLQNGPYKIWFGVENQTVQPPRIVAEEEFDTIAYEYTDFASAAPGVRIVKENMTAATVDFMNSSQEGNYLTVNVSINKSTNGTEQFWLDGGLEYVDESSNIWEFISGTGMEISLSKGLNIKSLNFNAGDIYNSGYDGPYTVWISLRNTTTWNDADNYEYITQAYTATDAPPPPISFVMQNGNVNYSFINESYLTINVTINVTSETYAGEYDIHGGVEYWNGQWWEHITGTGNWFTLENGTNTVQLHFNVGEINQTISEYCSNNPGSYYDTDPHHLAVFMGINEIGNWNEMARHQYHTQNFTKNDFPGPSATMEVDSYFINESSFTVNLTVDISSGNQGQYDIHGGIHYIDYSQGWDDWRFITGTGHDFTLENGSNDISLNFNGGEIHTALQQHGDSKLTAWLGIQEFGSWNEITHVEFETTETYSHTDFPGPGIMLNVTGDYNNQSGQYLTVNVTVTATEEYQNTPLDLHGGIHWKDGWEWRFISGTGTPLNLSNQQTNISINFNGGSIRSYEHDGPYEIWLGISEPESWEDLTHTEHTTEAYSYTSFAAPAVRIIQDNCSDFANQSQFITVNVSLNVDQADDYFLEGELFWKEGHHWQWITWTGDEISTTTGTNNYSLNFDATALSFAEEQGWNGQQLYCWLAVMNTTTWTEINRIDEYELQGSYSSEDFIINPISFNGTITEYPTNTSNATGNTEPYNLLNISIPLNISTPGTYNIGAALFDPINNTMITKANTTITTLVSSVNLSFNGSKIYKKGYNGSFEFRAKLFNSSTKKEYDNYVGITSSYQYNDFTEAIPEADLVDTYSSYIDSNGNLVVNITINVSNTGDGKEFEIYGELFHNQTETFITYNETVQILNQGENTTHLIFNGSAINSSTLNGPYLLTYLRLSVKLSGLWDEIEVEKDVHTTEAYTFDQFGG